MLNIHEIETLVSKFNGWIEEIILNENTTPFRTNYKEVTDAITGELKELAGIEVDINTKTINTDRQALPLKKLISLMNEWPRESYGPTHDYSYFLYKLLIQILYVLQKEKVGQL